MRGAITSAHDAVSNTRRIQSTRAPCAHACIDAGVIVRLPLMIGRAITPADRSACSATRMSSSPPAGSPNCVDAGAIVRQA